MPDFLPRAGFPNPAGLMAPANPRNQNMTTGKTLILTMCITGLLPLVSAQRAPPPARITSAEPTSLLRDTRVPIWAEHRGSASRLPGKERVRDRQDRARRWRAVHHGG